MMLKSIQHLLKSNYFEVMQTATAELCEKQNNGKVRLEGLPANYKNINHLLVRVPEGKLSHPTMIDDTTGLKQSCDYMLCILQEYCVDVYFIEMKTNISRDSDKIKACEQILNTVIVWNYLASMAEFHCNVQQNKIKKYFVIIEHGGRLAKQGVKPMLPLYHTHKNKKFKIIYSAETIPFTHLK